MKNLAPAAKSLRAASEELETLIKVLQNNQNAIDEAVRNLARAEAWVADEGGHQEAKECLEMAKSELETLNTISVWMGQKPRAVCTKDMLKDIDSKVNLALLDL